VNPSIETWLLLHKLDHSWLTPFVDLRDGDAEKLIYLVLFDSIYLGRKTGPAFVDMHEQKARDTCVMKRTVLSWAITQCVVVIHPQLFRTTYWSLLPGSGIQEGKELPPHTA